MFVEPKTQLELIRKALPGLRTVGLLYDPIRTAALVRKIRSAASQTGLELIADQIFRTKSVPPSIMEMREKIDLFWMLPDLTVLTPETVEFLILLTMESSTPILTFSEKYLEQGALLAIGFDSFDMGRQAR